MLESAVVRTIGASVFLGLYAALVIGCGGPSSVPGEAPVHPDASVPVGYHEPLHRLPPDTVEPIVLECFGEPFGEPFGDADPYYLGRETIVCRAGRWRSEYSLETGAGWSEGLLLPGLVTLTVHPPSGVEERAVGRPGLTRRADVLTDGPSLGVIALILAGCELGEGEEYRLPARDLRQGLDYDLEIVVGGWSDVETAWGARPCLEVFVEPQGFAFYLDDTGRPWSVRWPGGFAERAEYGHSARKAVAVETPEGADEAETAPTETEEPVPENAETGA
ncbi:MAG: hypothetical protein NTW26_09830 [bacterium]|nr:hypothetical protein [bacterium]